MTDLRSIAHEHEPLTGAPRCICIRASLENACAQHQELCRLAAPPYRTENNQAIAISDSEAAAAPAKEHTPPRWGPQNANYWLTRTEADSQAYIYASGELHIAATFCAAELQVSREIRLSELELHIFSLASPANELVTGLWKGRQLGHIKFLASGAKGDGASFALNGAYRRAWGLEP